MILKVILLSFIFVLCVSFFMLGIIAMCKKKDSIYDNEREQKNPLEGKKVVFVENDNEAENADGVRGHLEVVGEEDYQPGIYERYVKRTADIILSFLGMFFLAPVFAGIAILIWLDDPGPILFVQKRVGQNKQYIKVHKFRTMKMCTPHDVPTHMLDNPERFITKIGKFLRTHSLDELPQMWDIFVGNMSIIGPRPGLWNQDMLTAERDKYGANAVKPGLTGWAQINGRDELDIVLKARYDGEYVKKLSFKMDVLCFLGSVHVLSGDDCVVEGKNAEIVKEKEVDDGK